MQLTILGSKLLEVSNEFEARIKHALNACEENYWTTIGSAAALATQRKYALAEMAGTPSHAWAMNALSCARERHDSWAVEALSRMVGPGHRSPDDWLLSLNCASPYYEMVWGPRVYADD